MFHPRLLVLALLVPACEPNLLQQGPVGLPQYRSGQPAPVDDGNDLASYVAQCEAVLGPVPEISCDPATPVPGTFVTKIPVLVDGRPLGFAGDRVDAELLSQREETGKYECDFPSIGGDFPCSVGSTLVQYSDPATPWIQWVGLCRGVPTDTPSYDRFIGNGLIGANELTGEMCFFFGSNLDRDAPYELPPLTSDGNGDLSPWLPPRDMPGSCLSCHPNNDPWVMTPWLQPDYMQSVLSDPAYGLDLPGDLQLEDLLAARYVRQTPTELKTKLPTPLPSGRTAWTEEEIFDETGAVFLRQYRAVGSSYVVNESLGTVQPRTGMRPDTWAIGFRERLLLQPSAESCSNGCHALANENVVRMANDSLGTKYATAYLTESMAHDTPGFSWMPPSAGDPTPWRDRFEGGTPSIPAITECPLPRRLAVEDVEVSCENGVARIEWVYANSYGDVPGRDDVRFDVALSVAAEANDDRGASTTSPLEGVQLERDEHVTVLRDVEADRGAYLVEVPFESPQVAWAVDLQPKRFCFEEPDRRPFAYARPTRIVVDCS